MADPALVKRIAKGWLKRGDEEKDDFSKFIYYWISFNCFYSSWTRKEKDTPALQALEKDQTITSTYKNLMKGSNVKLVENLRAICPIYSVTYPNRSKSIGNIHNFGQVIWVLYQIRCNLFHGDKGEDIRRDLTVIRNALPVLNLILKQLLKNHLR
jgi:hypothetical protein